jgi:hypothetical protein
MCNDEISAILECGVKTQFLLINIGFSHDVLNVWQIIVCYLLLFTS